MQYVNIVHFLVVDILANVICGALRILISFDDKWLSEQDASHW